MFNTEQELPEKFLNNLFSGVYFVDPERKIRFWNNEAARITGYQVEDIINSYCYQVLLNHVDNQGNPLCQDNCPLQKAMDSKEIINTDIFLRHKQGYRIPVRVRVIPFVDSAGEVRGAAEIFKKQLSDNKQELVAEIEELKEKKLLDDLTELGNKKHLRLVTRQLLDGGKVAKNKIGFCFLDLDNFKDINDSYGHRQGDRLLLQVARTIRENIRPSDLAFRWGGDEFAVLLQGITGKDELIRISRRLLHMIRHTALEIYGHSVGVTVSIGATILRNDDTFADVLGRADSLMYKSKERGKNQVTSDLV